MANQVAVYIFGWYICSITLSLYNRWMFDPNRGLHIPYPIFITCFHQLTLYIISFIYVKIIKRDSSKKILSKNKKNQWKHIYLFIIPTALATAGDIGFANVSFKYIPLTIYTIIKSTSIAFVLLFGCLFKVEKFHWKLLVIVISMFIGVVFMSYPKDTKDTDDSDAEEIALGTILVLISSCLSGLRWVYTQLVLRKSVVTSATTTTTNNNNLLNSNSYNETENHNPHHHKPSVEIHIEDGTNGTVSTKDITLETDMIEKQQIEIPKHRNPIYTIYQLGPFMTLILFVTALIIERPIPGVFESDLISTNKKNSIGETKRVINLFSLFRGFLLVLFPGIAVFFMTLCEFGILQISKVLTLSIAGIAKEVLTIILGILILNERINGWTSWCGIAVIMLDVIYYNYFRYKQDLKNRNKNDINNNNSNSSSRDSHVVVPINNENENEGSTYNKHYKPILSISNSNKSSPRNSKKYHVDWDTHFQTISDNELFDYDMNTIGQRLEQNPGKKNKQQLLNKLEEC